MKEKSEVEDDLAKARFNLTEDLEMVLTFDEDAERKNGTVHTQRMSRGSLTIGVKFTCSSSGNVLKL